METKWKNARTGREVKYLMNILNDNPEFLEGIITGAFKIWIKNLMGRGAQRWHQGKGNLLKMDAATPRYCCLGVLCELSGTGNWMARRNTISNTFDFYFSPEHLNAVSRSATPPPEVWETYLGIDPDVGWWIAQVCINFNDKEGMSFEEIGQWLEDNILKPAIEAQQMEVGQE